MFVTFFILTRDRVVVRKSRRYGPFTSIEFDGSKILGTTNDTASTIADGDPYEAGVWTTEDNQEWTSFTIDTVKE